MKIEKKATFLLNNFEKKYL